MYFFEQQTKEALQFDPRTLLASFPDRNKLPSVLYWHPQMEFTTSNNVCFEIQKHFYAGKLWDPTIFFLL